MSRYIIGNTFKKDINRNINGVVKAENTSEEVIRTELEEYVVTNEVRRYMSTFFERYSESLQNPTEEIGVWIAGFFGSGKSHLLKMIGNILENKEHGDMKATQYFSEKIGDPILLGNLERSGSLDTDVILFNIDNVSDQDSYQNKEAIAVALLKKFNEYLGFFRDDLKVAEFERTLWKKGRFEEFKEKYEEEAGSTWEDDRRNLDFNQDFFLDVIEEMEIEGFSRESAERWVEKDSSVSVTPENLAELLEEYIQIKGKNQRIVFLIDEIGQYIGNSSNLMLNLQTVVEQIGTRLKGRVWIGVTSQQDMEAILEDNADRKNDFSKIQGRFKTMISLSSANIDEVIKRRLLEKTEAAKETLKMYYEENRVKIGNQINFENSGTLKLYNDIDDFTETYPFLRYQFVELQKIFDKVREAGHSGKHMSRGERSLLNAFQEAAKMAQNQEIGYIVPFNSFYSSIEQFLEDDAKRPIIHAREYTGLSEFSVEVLKLLFLLKGRDEIKTNIDNLTSFMVSHVDEDKIELKKKIEKSLRELLNNNYIQKDGDLYFFLTNEEQDVNREIRGIKINFDDKLKMVSDTIFTSVFGEDSIVIGDTGNRYKFTKRVNDKTFGSLGEELSITVLTPEADEYDGNMLMLSMSEEKQLIIKMDNGEYLKEIEEYLQVKQYQAVKGRELGRDSIRRILEGKANENRGRVRRIEASISEAIENGEVFISGSQSFPKSKKSKEIIKESIENLAKTVFNKAGLIKTSYDEKRIKNKFSYDTGGALFDPDKDIQSNPNKEAIEEMLGYLKRREDTGEKVTLKKLSEHFRKKPFGWGVYDINGIIGDLYLCSKVNIEYNGEILEDKNEVEKNLLKTQSGNLERVCVILREEIDPNLKTKIINKLKAIFGQNIVEERLEEKNLWNSLVNIIKIERMKTSEYLIKYDPNAKYPYPQESILSQWKELLQEIEHLKGKDTKKLKEFMDISEDLLDIQDDEETVKKFFDSNMQSKFDLAVEKLEDLDRNSDFVREVFDHSSVKELKKIISLPKPYEQLKYVDMNIETLDDVIGEIVNREKESLKSKGAELLKEVEDKVKDTAIVKEASELIEDFVGKVDSSSGFEVFYKHYSLTQLRENIVRTYRRRLLMQLNEQSDKLSDVLKDKEAVDDLIMDSQAYYNTIKDEINGSDDLQKLDSIIAGAETETKHFIDVANDKAEKKEKVKISFKKVIKRNIETESEAKEYIDKLQAEVDRIKEEILSSVRSNKRIDID
jgi:hypothetical protein